ncbi:MAG: hypothetical protein IKG81_08730 [Bacteroidales bacterium]|nr:hypothetical protein [Bacteroidales bacterium]
MLTIGHPYIEEREQETALLSHVTDEVRNREYEIWYSVDKKYGKYLCDDYADSYLLLVLQWAMKSGQDIRVEAPVSPRLLFNINNTIQPLFEKMLVGSKQVRIDAQTMTEPQYDGKAVGCCCSLGVDSFCSFLKHNGDDVPKDYRVTHLTLFNSGQLGYIDMKGTEQNFRNTIQSLQPFVEETGLPFVAIDTNLSEFYVDTGIKITNNDIDRTISCALALQKLFGKYVFSSSYSAEHFTITNDDEAHIEAVFTPLLGTDNMEVILSDPVMTRVEKTRYISQFPITTKYLDVCWAGQMANGKYKENGTNLLKNKKKTNCGQCGKCLRTMLTLDLLGVLHQYEEQFDMDYYLSHKDWYIAKVLTEKENKVPFREIAELLEQKGFHISFRIRRKLFLQQHPWTMRTAATIKKLFK